MQPQSITFEEGKPCPLKIEGEGGGLSVSPNGEMLLLGTFPNPTKEQIEAWGGKWRAKLYTETEFPAIPIFAIGSEEWILEAPCNPTQLETEAPGFAEAMFAKEENEMVAVLVDGTTGIIKKITQVPLDDLFIERLVMSWNPFRGPADQYNKTFDNDTFQQRIREIFKMKSQRELWRTSW